MQIRFLPLRKITGSALFHKEYPRMFYRDLVAPAVLKELESRRRISSCSEELVQTTDIVNPSNSHLQTIYSANQSMLDECYNISDGLNARRQVGLSHQ